MMYYHLVYYCFLWLIGLSSVYCWLINLSKGYSTLSQYSFSSINKHQPKRYQQFLYLKLHSKSVLDLDLDITEENLPFFHEEDDQLLPSSPQNNDVDESSYHRSDEEIELLLESIKQEIQSELSVSHSEYYQHNGLNYSRLDNDIPVVNTPTWWKLYIKRGQEKNFMKQISHYQQTYSNHPLMQQIVNVFMPSNIHYKFDTKNHDSKLIKERQPLNMGSIFIKCMMNGDILSFFRQLGGFKGYLQDKDKRMIPYPNIPEIIFLLQRELQLNYSSMNYTLRIGDYVEIISPESPNQLLFGYIGGVKQNQLRIRSIRSLKEMDYLETLVHPENVKPAIPPVDTLGNKSFWELQEDLDDVVRHTITNRQKIQQHEFKSTKYGKQMAKAQEQEINKLVQAMDAQRILDKTIQQKNDQPMNKTTNFQSNLHSNLPDNSTNNTPTKDTPVMISLQDIQQRNKVEHQEQLYHPQRLPPKNLYIKSFLSSSSSSSTSSSSPSSSIPRLTYNELAEETMVQLKERLRKHDLAVTGNKALLISRLLQYHNKNSK